jgi:predicted MFS family arabinose efflux permease
MSNDTHNIEAALRASEPTLADDDFSVKVLARLPPRRRRSTARRWTLAGAACLGSALTAIFAPPLGEAFASLMPWMIPPLAATTVAILVIVMVPGLYFLYSERSDR